ncbi:hypothetical protein [Nocardia sp. NPDC004860]|uniref:hypothetical protein n=1 Tax=Nocardia sp. NPDC004860 TaxID=3154557 RepID=UPI0033B2D69F
MTDPMDNMTPADVAAMIDRLEFTDAPVTEADLGIDVGATAKPVWVPRSVKMPYDLDAACKARAKQLGLEQSTYIRSLIERDIAAAGTGGERPAWVQEILAVIAHHEHDEHRKAS